MLTYESQLTILPLGLIMPAITLLMQNLLLASTISIMSIANANLNPLTRQCTARPHKISQTVSDVASIKKLFPTTEAEIAEIIALAKTWTLQVHNIINLTPENQNYTNTFRMLDQIQHEASCCMGILSVIENAHPEKTMRDAAHAGLQGVSDFFTDQIELNKALYQVLKDDAKRWINPNYLMNILPTEALTTEEFYYVEETLNGFRRSGLHLDGADFQRVQILAKELNELALKFQQNINTDQSSILVDPAELVGVPANIIANLEKAGDHQVIIKTDYPTIFGILDYCENSEIRRKTVTLFDNIAYPQNQTVLNDLINKRDELAQLIGFTSYAEMDLDNQMAKQIEIVETFTHNLNLKAQIKAQKEIQQLLAAYPDAQQLVNPQGLIYPWNTRFLKNYYKKHQLNLDMQLIAEYFPMAHTLQELLNIYEQFLGIKFKTEKIDLWYSDLDLLTVYRQEQLLGYIILDLHPRANKFNHAASFSTVHTILNDQGATPAVDVIMANFPKAQGAQPALLNFNDVVTFFHEFGHALHTVLGATNIAAFSGTQVKRDFVEMPSQMLENWLRDPAIIKQVSCHYQTGAQLPDALINGLAEINKFDAGDFIARQLYYTKLSLELFKAGQNKDLSRICEQLHQEFRSYVAAGDTDHHYAAFGHLTGYGAKYYGYMWSNVFAKDLFEKIKAGGLLNPEMGKLYIDKIIGKGGSKDPNHLIEDFLGRKPTETAFLREMGLE